MDDFVVGIVTGLVFIWGMLVVIKRTYGPKKAVASADIFTKCAWMMVCTDVYMKALKFVESPYELNECYIVYETNWDKSANGVEPTFMLQHYKSSWQTKPDPMIEFRQRYDI